jgi:fucose 4-O-acetylase-like acetyltransferase
MKPITRLTEFDIIKGICILLVVIGHYAPENAPPLYNSMRSIIYSFHMPAFMFASGYIYLATYKKTSYHSFIFKKFYRLFLPYLAISSFIIVTKIFSSKGLYVQNPVTWTAFYQQFYYPIAGFFLWFIYTLFLIFLIVPVFDNKNKRLILFFISLLFYFLPLKFPEYFCLAQLKGMLVFFMLGTIAYENVNVKYLYKVKNLILTSIIFIGLNLFRDNPFYQFGFPFLTAVTGIIMVLIFSDLISRNEIKIKDVLIQLGFSSYTIYLLHTTFEGFSKAVLLKVNVFNFGNEMMMFYISAFLIILTGVIGPYLFEKWIITRSKQLCFVFGVKYQKKEFIPKTDILIGDQKL